MRHAVLAVPCLLALSVATSWAQRPFVDAALYIDQDDAYHGDGSMSLGRGIAAGIVWERRSVRVEYDVPRWRTDGSRPAPRFARRTVAFDALYGRRVFQSDRIRVEALGGGGYAWRRWATPSYSTSRDHPLVITGLDVGVALRRKVTLVPAFRVRVFPFAGLDDGADAPALAVLLARIGIRWQF